MTIHPKQQRDLMLAPVAAEIDLNLQRLRHRTVREVVYELELELDCEACVADRGERADLVLRQAIREVDTHGWNVAITDDGCRVHLGGGSVSLDVGLSDGIIAYIQGGVDSAQAEPAEVGADCVS